MAEKSDELKFEPVTSLRQRRRRAHYFNIIISARRDCAFGILAGTTRTHQSGRISELEHATSSCTVNHRRISENKHLTSLATVYCLLLIEYRFHHLHFIPVLIRRVNLH